MMRSAAAGMAVLAASAWLGTACVDPKTDYDDWMIRTTNLRNQTPPESDASFEAGLPDGGFTQLYLMACVSQLTDGTIATPTLFTATATFTPSESGGGSLDFSDAVLAYNATSLSQTVAATVSEMGVPVAADGTAVINYGPTTIPPAGNPLQNGEVDFSALILTFQIGPGTDLCANVTGAYSAPVSEQITVVGQNVCIYVPMANMTDPLPTLTQSQVHCP
jgi:hypothetical protein